MVSDNGIEIRRGTGVVLSDLGARRRGKARSFHKRPRALEAAITLTPAGRVLTIFILNNGRPGGSDYSLH